MAELHNRAMAMLRDRHREEYEEILAKLRGPERIEGEQQLVRVVNCACGKAVNLLPGQMMGCRWSDGVRTVFVSGEVHHECREM